MSWRRRAMNAAGGPALPGVGRLGKLGKLVGPLARGIPGVGTALTGLSVATSLFPRTTAAAGAALGAVAFPRLGRAAAAVPGAISRSWQPGEWPRNKDGTPRRQRKDGRPWKRPSMQAGNTRALRRSIRRVQAAEKLFRTVLSVQGKKASGIRPKKKGR